MLQRAGTPSHGWGPRFAWVPLECCRVSPFESDLTAQGGPSHQLRSLSNHILIFASPQFNMVRPRWSPLKGAERCEFLGGQPTRSTDSPTAPYSNTMSKISMSTKGGAAINRPSTPIFNIRQSVGT